MAPIALVTGVSRVLGIGRALCLELAARGMDVFFTGFAGYDAQMPWGSDESDASSIQGQIEALGVRCAHLNLDLTRPGAVEALLERVRAQLGAPSVLINNATYSTACTLEAFDVEVLDAHYAVNVRATLELTMAFVRTFDFDEGGRIINLSSGQSLGPMSDEIAYAVTKASIETFTTTLAQRVAPLGITINAVNPGPTDTGWMDPELHTQLRARSPFGRVGEPEDVARLVGFLCSKEGAWVTGQIIHSEGGFIR